MVTYRAEVFTGNLYQAGTMNKVYLQLVGTKGASPVVCIIDFMVLHQGSVGKIDIKCDIDLGELYLIKLHSETRQKLGDLDWFCAKITVRTPGNVTVLFPCYNWLSSTEPLSVRQATAMLVFKDRPEGLKHRQKELRHRRKLFEWNEYTEGLPQSVKVDNPAALPRLVKFSFTKESEFLLTAKASLIELQLQGLLSSKEPWHGMSQYQNVHCGQKTDSLKYVEDHWKEDEFFGYQFLNGLNPMMIKRCSKLPENFPVTDDMVKPSLQGHGSLTQEIKNGNIYLADYVLLDGITANVVNNKQQYLTAPLVLLYNTPADKLIPIAIQLKQKPGGDNPIFLPTDSEYDWLMAKIFVRSADFAVHELNFHLLRTHLISEVFAMATLRCLPEVHPLFKLLNPHFRYTLQINVLARAQLISKDGVITQYAAAGGTGMLTLLHRSMASLTYSSLCLPEDIAARGLESIPNFYYRDDGLQLWDMLNRYVKGMVEFYYTSDSDVENDSELQTWINEVFVYGFLSESCSGIPERFRTVTELIKFLTMVVFTASVQHAAVNNGQYDFDGWMPNSPMSLQLGPPTTKGQCTEETMWKTFPDINVTAQSMATVYLLSKQSSDFVPLGSFPDVQFSEATPLEKIKNLRTKLKMFACQVNARNVELPLPYTFLYPENMENSVAI